MSSVSSMLSALFSAAGCPSAEEGNVEWPVLHCNQRACHPCSKYHPSFKGGSVVRRCNDDGDTLNLDFSQCYVKEGEFTPKFAVVWVIFSGRSGSTYTRRLTSIKLDVSSFLHGNSQSGTERFVRLLAGCIY